MESISVPYFELCHIGTVIKTVWSWWRESWKDQWNRIENEEIYSSTSSQLV